MRLRVVGALAAAAGASFASTEAVRAATPDAAVRAALAGAAYGPVAIRGARPPAAQKKTKSRKPALYAERFVPGRGLVRWAVDPHSPPEAAFDTFPYARLPDGSPPGPDDLVPIRDRAQGFGGDEISLPYGSRRRANQLGLGDGSGPDGRWFLFASIKGRAVGYQFVPIDEAGTVATGRGGFLGRAQAGIGYRRGEIQTTLGYLYERIRFRALGMKSRDDSRVEVTVSWLPGPAPTPVRRQP